MQRVRHANIGRLILWKPGLVPLWDLHVFPCWDQSRLNLSCFRTFEFRISLGSSVLLCPYRSFNSIFKLLCISSQKALLVLISYFLSLHEKCTNILSQVGIFREKGRYLTQSYDNSPYIHTKIQKGNVQYNNATKTSITDRHFVNVHVCVERNLETKFFAVKK